MKEKKNEYFIRKRLLIKYNADEFCFPRKIYWMKLMHTLMSTISEYCSFSFYYTVCPIGTIIRDFDVNFFPLSRIKINPQYSRILASRSPRRSSSSHLRCRNSDPSSLSAYSHTPKRRSHSFSYVRTPIIRSTLSPSLTKSMNNSQPASAITQLRSAPSSHRVCL